MNSPSLIPLVRRLSRLVRPLPTMLACGLAPSNAQAAPAEMADVPGGYSQNFDALPGSGTVNVFTDDSTIPGVYAQRGSGASNIRATTGSTTPGDLYSFGAAGESERALGSIGSGSTGDFAYGVQLQNTSGSALEISSLGYTGEQWRNSKAPEQIITLWYRIAGSPIADLTPSLNDDWTALPAGNFASPVTGEADSNALNGNDSVNRVAVSIAPGIAVGAGQYIMFRWRDPDHSGTDHGLAIDDVAIGWVSSATPGLSLSAAPDHFSENAGSGAATGTVTVSQAPSVDLTVNLFSDDETEATLPGSVVILAGTTQATFSIAAVNDLLADGSQTVVFSAQAAGHTAGQIAISVEDDTDAALSVSILPDTFAENAGSHAAVGTVTLAEITPVDLAVSLSSSDTSEATVPSGVTVPAGSKSVTFNVAAIDDAVGDGTVDVAIGAKAAGYSDGVGVVHVTNDADATPPATLAAGAIAFIEFDSDGTDGLGFVALAPIAGADVIYFTDKSWNGLPMEAGGAFGANEGVLKWTAPAGGVAAGSVIHLSGLTGTMQATAGTLAKFGAFNANSTGETVYAYQGDQEIVLRFIAIVSTNADSKDYTGLAGSNVVQLPNNIDVAAYTGPRAGQNGFAGYLPLIADAAANWVTQDGADDQDHDGIAPDFPYDSTFFTIGAGNGTTFAAYAAAHAGGQGPGGDYDRDGVPNAVEYFFGETGSGFTANPQPVAGVIAFPHDPAANDVSYKVTTSADLIHWTDVTAASTDAAGFVEYMLPTGAGPIFVRLEVTVPGAGL